MNASDVMAFAKSRLQEKFNVPVYVDSLPQDFVRPSFALELQKPELTELNLGLVRWTAVLLITGYVDVDEYYDSSRELLNLLQDGVLELFSGGWLKVGDRFPTVAAIKGKGDPDFFEVQVTFTWSDARPGFSDPEETAPMMGQYELSMFAPDRVSAGEKQNI